MGACRTTFRSFFETILSPFDKHELVVPALLWDGVGMFLPNLPVGLFPGGKSDWAIHTEDMSSSELYRSGLRMSTCS